MLEHLVIARVRNEVCLALPLWGPVLALQTISWVTAIKQVRVRRDQVTEAPLRAVVIDPI
jgi:hypothetical protein